MRTTELQTLTDDELQARASAAGVAGTAGMRRDDLIAALRDDGEAMTRSEERLVGRVSAAAPQCHRPVA